MTTFSTDHCLNCGHLIFPPNTVSGYAGPVCYCPKDPATQYQRPASKAPPANPPFWADRIARLESALKEAREFIEQLTLFQTDEHKLLFIDMRAQKALDQIDAVLTASTSEAEVKEGE